MLSRRLLPVVLALLAGLLSGCGQRTLEQKETHTVKGKVKYNDKPASYVIVRFEPVDKEGVEATGTTDAEGVFELRTYSNEGSDGAVAGTYKVIIEQFDPVRGGKVPAGAKGTPIKGGRVESKQNVEITEGDNTPEIDVP